MKFNLKFFGNSKSRPTKIGILYICTGKYHVFWNGFYKSARKFFCKTADVHYFVFTEHNLKKYHNKNIHHIFQSRLGWPFDTLKRFHLFLEHERELMEMDFLFFFNANMVFKQTMMERDILPSNNKIGLTSVMHPYFYDHKMVPPFEDNPESTAYIEASTDIDYFQGCLSGGRTSEYLHMAREIKKMVDIDLEKNIIGKWWDESYMNKFFQTTKPEKLDPGFAMPEGLMLPFKERIVQLDKMKWGGHDFLRAGDS